MFLIVGALPAVVITLSIKLPVSGGGADRRRSAAGRMRVLRFFVQLSNTYTLAGV